MLGGIVFAQAGYYAVFGMTFALVAVDIVLRLLMIEVKVAANYATDENLARETDAPVAADVKHEEIPTEILAVAEDTKIARRLPSMVTLLRSPRLLSALFGCLVQAILYTSFDGVLPIYVNHIFGWNSLGAGLIFLNLCIPSLFEPIVGAMSDKYGVRWLATAGFVLSLPGFVLLRFVTYNSLGQKVLLCALLVFIGFSVSLVIPPLLAEITMTVEAKEKESPGIFGKRGAYAQAYALFNMAFAAGTMIGPIWAGFVVQSAGWGTMGWTLGLLSILTAVPTVSDSQLHYSRILANSIQFIWAGGRFRLKGSEQEG
jgi:hypothetical protein